MLILAVAGAAGSAVAVVIIGVVVVRVFHCVHQVTSELQYSCYSISVRTARSVRYINAVSIGISENMQARYLCMQILVQNIVFLCVFHVTISPFFISLFSQLRLVTMNQQLIWQDTPQSTDLCQIR